MPNLNTAITLGVVVALVGLNFPMFRIVDGYSVTFALIIIACYCFFVINYVRVGFALAYGILISFLFINAAMDSWLDEWEFIKSFLQTAVMLFVYFTSLSPIEQLQHHIEYKRIVRLATYPIAIFLLIQIFEQLLLGTTTSWFWLNNESIAANNAIGRFEAVNFLGTYRPISFYYEPSYMAAVAFILLLINDSIQNYGIVKYLLILIIVASLSSLMIIVLVIYFVICWGLNNKVFFFISVFVLITIVVFHSDQALEFSRLSEISREGTSGYMRVMEPLHELNSYMEKYHFGIPLGQSQIVFHNSILLIPLYFGVLSPIFILVLLIVIANKVRKIENLFKYLMGVSTLLLANGSIFGIESSLLLLLLNYRFIPAARI